MEEIRLLPSNISVMVHVPAMCVVTMCVVVDDVGLEPGYVSETMYLCYCQYYTDLTSRRQLSVTPAQF